MQIRVVRAEGHLRVELSGRQGPEDMQQAITRMLDECRRHETPQVLLVTRASRPLFKLEDFSLSAFLDRMTPACRVAMVADNAELRASDDYIASAARLKHLAVRTFADEAAAVRWLRGEGERKYRFSRIVLAGAPHERGVYALWKNEEVIYYGHASGGASIRARLLEHYQRGVEATHYSWEMCRDPAEREAELLREFEESHGRTPLLNAS